MVFLRTISIRDTENISMNFEEMGVIFELPNYREAFGTKKIDDLEIIIHMTKNIQLYKIEGKRNTWNYAKIQEVIR